MKFNAEFLIVIFVSLFSATAGAECLFNDPRAMLSDVRQEMESRKISEEKVAEYRKLMTTHKICPEELARLSAEALSFQAGGRGDTYSYRSSLEAFLRGKGLGDQATNLAMDMGDMMKSLTQKRLGNPYINRIANLDLPLEDKKKAIYIVFVARYYGNKLGIGENGVADIGKEKGPEAVKIRNFEAKKNFFKKAIQEKSKGGDPNIIAALAEALARHNEIVGDALSPKAAGSGVVKATF